MAGAAASMLTLLRDIRDIRGYDTYSPARMTGSIGLRQAAPEDGAKHQVNRYHVPVYPRISPYIPYIPPELKDVRGPVRSE